MPKVTLSNDAQQRTEYLRDDHDESGTVYVRHWNYDEPILERNKRARLDRLLRPGAKMGIHDGAEIVYHFQIPSARQWQRFKRRHPEIAEGIGSPVQAIREKASADLAALRPEWVVCSPKNHMF